MAVRNPVSNDLFWVLAVWIGALLAGVAFAVVIGRVVGAGFGASIFFGAIIFVLTGWLVASLTSASNLPPPNTLTAPTVPRNASTRTEAPKAAFLAGDAARAPVAAAGGVAGREASDMSGALAGEVEVARDETRLAFVEADEIQPGEAAVEVDVVYVRPAGFAAPREGGADDLKRIKGVGPKLETLLHGLGVFHFDQIAAWGPADIAWIDANLEGFTGRASRDDWVGQSKTLAEGGETEHSKRVDRGEST